MNPTPKAAEPQGTPSRLSVRVAAHHPNHHLWSNHGQWWCHFTVHQPDFTKLRVRRSLGTRHLEEARQIRDFLFAVLPGPPGPEVSDLSTN